MTYILIIYLFNAEIKVDSFETKEECLYKGAVMEAETRTSPNFKTMYWDCIEKKD